jgi:DNA-binding GntR family transcriptional regulator
MSTTDGAGLGEIAYGRVRHAIVRLELAPGAPISEQQLVDEFGLTKAAVRAALARLRADGLVRAAPRRAHVVAPVTLHDVREIYELRLAVEPVAAAAAATRIGAEELRRLRRSIADPPDLRREASVDRFLTGNRAVHVGVAAASGNHRLERLVSQLLDDSERVILLAMRAGHDARRINQDHRALLAALAERDADAAGEAMQTGIAGFRDELIAALVNSEAMARVPLAAGAAP